ncbi:hypothetical protein BC827DRAFT_1265503 [Russula dissimulans]|nr:hypothetical protein BC827DRAFT_1265503 [Russula dissimulans]
MSTGRLGRLLETTPNSKSPTEVKGKNACDRRRATPAPSTTNAEHRYSSAGGLWVKTVVRHHRRSAEYLWWSVRLNCRSSKTYRNGHLLFNVPEEVDDDELEILLEEDGLYLGSYGHLVRVYSIVPITSLLVWVLLVVAPPLLWPSPLSTTPQALYFPTPLPELLFSISLFALSHQLNPYLFTIAGGLLFTPNGHKRARDGAPSAFPTLALAVPGGTATIRAPPLQHVWWLALGCSLAEVTAGVVQWYEMMELYRNVLVPESDAHELAASSTSTWTPPQAKTNRSESASPPLAADEPLRES